MRIDNMIRMWLRALFRRNRVEEDLDEELRYHVERRDSVDPVATLRSE